MKATKIILSLGSNMGNRRENLVKALSMLEEFCAFSAKSRIYSTPPVGYEDQRDFLNAAVFGETLVEPMELLRQCKRLERELGREENFANGETFDAPFEKVETADRIVENHARNDDIDLNAHVNNSVFLIWALDSVPDEFQRDRLPERLKISFLKEVLPQNIISSQCQLSGDRSIHSLVNKSDGSECARINIDWKQLA